MLKIKFFKRLACIKDRLGEKSSVGPTRAVKVTTVLDVMDDIKSLNFEENLILMEFIL